MAAPFTQEQVNAYVGELQKLVDSGQITQDTANRTIANEMRYLPSGESAMATAGQVAQAFPGVSQQEVADIYNQLSAPQILSGNMGVSGNLAEVSPDLFSSFADSYNSIISPPQNIDPDVDSGSDSPAAPTSMFDTSLDYMKRSAEGTEALASYTPETVTAGTLPGVDISQYMDPYTQEVIDTSLADLERQRLIQQQGIGAQAQAAGAFGGSRMGIQEAMTNEAFARQAGTLAAGLRSAGFTQAQNLAQTDLARQLSADQLNQAAGLSGAQFQLGAYNQLGGMGLTGYNLANQQMNQFMANEAMKQGLQTNLYGQQVGQATGFFGQPVQSLPYVSAALGASPMPQTTSQSYAPGLMDFLTLGAYAKGVGVFSDERLKKDIEEVKTLSNGVKVVRWKWNDIGKKIANPDQPTFGVIAQQVAKIIPDAVMKHASGYLMVDYSHPELRGV